MNITGLEVVCNGLNDLEQGYNLDINVLQNRNGVNEPNNNHAFLRTFYLFFIWLISISKVFFNLVDLLGLSDGSYNGLK